MEEKKLKGLPVAEFHLNEIKKRIEVLSHRGITPCLRVVLVGDDPASKIYTSKKAEKCQQIGMDGEIISMPENSSTEQVLDVVKSLNEDKKVHGILVQLPLPPQIDEKSILYAVSPHKDVDGFHPNNIGRLQIGDSHTFIPCTALGIAELLHYYHVPIEGSHIAIIGRSNIVGKPLAQIFSSKGKFGNATVTICHSRTKNISQFTQQADIVVVAMGVPLFLKGDMIKEGTILIDVGINPTPEDSEYYGHKKIVGDIDFNSVQDKARGITPVPGGVGPLTIAMLMKNTVQAAEQLST